jgi:hypothetical protein
LVGKTDPVQPVMPQNFAPRNNVKNDFRDEEE